MNTYRYRLFRNQFVDLYGDTSTISTLANLINTHRGAISPAFIRDAQYHGLAKELLPYALIIRSLGVRAHRAVRWAVKYDCFEPRYEELASWIEERVRYLYRSLFTMMALDKEQLLKAVSFVSKAVQDLCLAVHDAEKNKNKVA